MRFLEGKSQKVRLKLNKVLHINNHLVGLCTSYVRKLHKYMSVLNLQIDMQMYIPQSAFLFLYLCYMLNSVLVRVAVLNRVVWLLETFNVNESIDDCGYVMTYLDVLFLLLF